MLAKRSYNTAKNMANRTIKSKEPNTKTPNRSNKTSYQTDFIDFEPKSPTFPHIKSSENNDLLPCYSGVLTKSAEEGINMKDLDQLQQELEKLLSMCSIRTRSLYTELELLDKNEIERHEKKAKIDRPSSPKIRKVETERKVKESKSFKILKNVHDELPKVDIPKIVIPKNDTKSKFWASIDPYCAPIDADDIAYLDDLIQEVNTDIDVKVPPLGPHYTLNWNGDTVSNHFQSGMVNFQHSKNKLVSMLTDDSFFKNQKNGFCNKDSYATSLLLPLASALLEEKVVNNFPNTQEKIEKFKDLGIRNLNNTSVCLDKRMRKELVDLGILNSNEEDIKPPPNLTNDDDQILEEIKKCQQELVTVNEHNKRELNHLRYLIDKDMVRQELNEKLDKVDGQIMDVYNRLLSETKDKVDIEWEAVKIIQLQRKLHKEAMEMTDVRL